MESKRVGRWEQQRLRVSVLKLLGLPTQTHYGSCDCAAVLVAADLVDIDFFFPMYTCR